MSSSIGSSFVIGLSGLSSWWCTESSSVYRKWSINISQVITSTRNFAMVSFPIIHPGGATILSHTSMLWAFIVHYVHSKDKHLLQLTYHPVHPNFPRLHRFWHWNLWLWNTCVLPISNENKHVTSRPKSYSWDGSKNRGKSWLLFLMFLYSCYSTTWSRLLPTVPPSLFESSEVKLIFRRGQTWPNLPITKPTARQLEDWGWKFPIRFPIETRCRSNHLCWKRASWNRQSSVNKGTEKNWFPHSQDITL